MTTKADLLLEKLAEKGEPVNVTVKNDPLSRVISAPYRYLNKLMLADPQVGVGKIKDFSDYTLKFINKRSKENPDLKFEVGHSPILSQMGRALSGKSTVLKNPIFRPLSVPLAGANAAFGKLTGMDYYNPFSNTAVVRSDSPGMVALNLGQHLDLKKRKFPNLYYFGTSTPLTKPIRLYNASKIAGEYLTKDQAKILTPSLGLSAIHVAPAVAPLLLAGSHAIKGQKGVNFGKRKTIEKL